MVTNLAWLAAALSPSDIAPHPNFFSREQVDESSLFALLCDARWSDLYRLTHDDPFGPPGGNDYRQDDEYPLIELAKSALTSGTTEQGANALAAMVRGNLTEVQPLDCKWVAVGLLACVSYAELDLEPRGVELLTSILEALEGSGATSNTNLVRGVLHQQIAVRLWDIEQREEARQHADSARNFLSRVIVDDLEDFRLSLGVGWNSRRTCSDILEAMDAAAASLLATTAGAFADGWEDIVRQRPGFLDLKALRSITSGLHMFVDDTFDATYPDGSVTYGRTASPDNYLYSALLQGELQGQPSVRAARADLGLLRFIDSTAGEKEWRYAESLNLLRRGRDFKRLRTALIEVQRSGPFSALQDCAAQILEARRDPASWTLGEVLTLRFAVDVLTREQAMVLERAVAKLIRDRSTALSFDKLTLLEEALIAAAELSNRDPLSPFFARLINEVILTWPREQLFDNAIVRAIRAFDWQPLVANKERHVPDSLMDEEGAAGDEISRALRSALALPQAQTDGDDDNSSLRSIADVANAWLSQGTPISGRQAGVFLPALEQHLSQLRREASQGVQTRYALDGVATAVVVALATNGDEIWNIVSGVLLDGNLPAQTTDAAFEILAFKATSVPSWLRDRVAQNWYEVLYTRRESGFEPETIKPNPNALSFLVASHGLTLSQLLNEITLLLGSTSDASRRAGAKVLGLFAESWPGTLSDWVAATALNLTRDRDTLVQARAGRALCILLQYGRASELDDLSMARLDELLAADGLALPATLMAELGRTATVLPPLVLRRVEQLAGESRSSLLRRRAEVLLAGARRE